MKFKQILATVAISAATAFITLLGYNRFVADDIYVYRNATNDSGKTPFNYTGFNGLSGANASIDFIPAASATIPATVHIKTKTNRTVSNNLPRRSPFGDMFDLDLEDLFGDRSPSLP